MAMRVEHIHVGLYVAKCGRGVWRSDAVDLDSVRDDLAGVVQDALEPVHVSVWVSRGA